MVFSNSTARASAITTPNEGMLTWLEDVNRFQYYSGSAWVDLGDEPSGWSDKSANYSIVAADLGTTIRSTGSAITITIDNVLTQQGDRIDFIQAGAGQITFAAGASLWLDATNDGSFTYSSGTVVSQWSDLSGNGYHFTQATLANQPNRNGTQNGLSAVTFGGDFVANTSLNWGASNSTLFFVGRENKALGTTYQNMFTTGTGATGQWGYGLNDNSAGEQISIFDIGQNLTAFNFAMGASNADVLVFTSAGISAGSVTANLFKNGTADSTNPRTIITTTSAAGAVLGSDASVAEPYYGTICEVILYPSQLGTSDRNLVEAYLKAKWGTP